LDCVAKVPLDYRIDGSHICFRIEKGLQGRQENAGREWRRDRKEAGGKSGTPKAGISYQVLDGLGGARFNHGQSSAKSQPADGIAKGGRRVDPWATGCGIQDALIVQRGV